MSAPCRIAGCAGTDDTYFLHLPSSNCVPCRSPQDHHTYQPAAAMTVADLLDSLSEAIGKGQVHPNDIVLLDTPTGLEELAGVEVLQDVSLMPNEPALRLVVATE